MTHILFYKKINSTQLEARRYIQSISAPANSQFSGDASSKSGKTSNTQKHHNNESIVIVAKNQTGGIGRQNREWKNRDGESLLTTICIKKRTPNQSISIMPIIAGVCALKAITANAKNNTNNTSGTGGASNIKLKWPNDILHNGNKLGGILTESFLDYFIIGVGINLFPTPISKRETSSLKEAQCLPDYINQPSKTQEEDIEDYAQSRQSLIQLAGAIAKEIENEISNVETNGTDKVINEWRKNAWGIGSTVSFHKSADEIITGKMLNIDEDGGLLLELENGDIKKFTFGEILF